MRVEWRIIRRSLAARWALSSLILGTILVARSARADSPSATARDRFQRGYALASEGDYEAAIVEFEAAYATSPNFSVLFNLGQAYGAAGHAVEASHNLEKYLELGGSGIAPDQREKVRRLIVYYRRRVGRLELHVAPDGATAMLDGKELGRAPFTVPIEVTAGLHGLSLSFPGYESVQTSILIAGQQTTLSNVELSRHQEPASLQIDCALGDVLVTLDNRAVGSTPLPALLRIGPGEHDLQLSRAGYRSTQQRLALAAGQVQRVACALESDPSAAGAATLHVVHPRGTGVRADGRPFSGGRLPAGRHLLEVAGPGYEAVRRTVTLVRDTVSTVALNPHRSGPSLEDELNTRAHAQRLAALVVGGAALAAGTTAIVLALSNVSRYSDWQARDQRFLAAYSKDPASASPKELDQLLREEDSIRNRDRLALSLGIVASTLAVTSGALYLLAPRLKPTLVLSARGSALGLAGRW